MVSLEFQAQEKASKSTKIPLDTRVSWIQVGKKYTEMIELSVTCSTSKDNSFAFYFKLESTILKQRGKMKSYKQQNKANGNLIKMS